MGMNGREWSIIIPALNEEKHMDLCLQSLCNLGGEPRPEVIVVDNGSTDRTVAIAQSYRERLALRVAVRGGATVAGLRNWGATTATGKYLAFLDADCLAPASWLKEASEVLRERPHIIAGAYYALPQTAGWPAKVWHARFHQGKQGEVAYVPGGSMLMERGTFSKVGGFDGRLRSNEDSQLCSRARALGLQVVVVPSLAVTHLGAEKSLLHFAKRQRWHGSNILSRSGLRGNRRAICLAAYTLLCLFSLAVCAPSGKPVFVATGLLGLLLPPAWMGLQPRKGVPARQALPLVLLLLVYAVVRAGVLPVAAFRACKQTLSHRHEQSEMREDGRALRT